MNYRSEADNLVYAIRSYCLAVTILLLSVAGAAAQLPPPTVVPPVPNPNPSSSLVLPPTRQAPVSPAPGGGGSEGLSPLRPYHSGCSVFRNKPCFPYYLPPIGQDLRLTIVSTDEKASQTEHRELAGADDHPPRTRSVTCLPRYVLVGCRRRRRRRTTVWNTPSVSPSSGTAR